MLLFSLGRHDGPCTKASLPTVALLLSVFLSISSFASAQLVKGQFFTTGLAISDSPAPQSQTNAGGSLNIAIDLSGDGKLSQEAFLPTSNLPSAYQLLNIYLVSAETNHNFTVSEGPQLLQQEPGSTVKHFNWPIPECILSGNYNLTYYELSRINQISYYSITPIPIVIKSQSTSSCSDVGAAAPQPQAASPPPQQPWLTPGYSITTTPLSPSSTPNGNGSQSGAAPFTSTPSNSAPSNSGTVTITLSPSPTTVTFVSTMTIPTTVSGLATVFTTATTISSVSTVFPSSSGAFLPVNAAVPGVLGSLHPLNWIAIAIVWACIVAI